MSATPEVTPTVETKPEATVTTPTVETTPTTPTTPEATVTPTPEDTGVQISTADLRGLQQAKTERDAVQKEVARLKGVAGKQAAEITRLKTVQPAPTEDPDVDPQVDPQVSKVYDDRLATLEAKIQADEQRRTEEETQRQDSLEQDAILKVREKTVEVGVKAGMARLKITDPKVAAVAAFTLDGMLRAVAADDGTPLEEMDGAALTVKLTEILPEIEAMLGYRVGEQAATNDVHRTTLPSTKGGAPGVTTGKLPSQMSEVERLKYYEEISAKHDGRAS